MRKLLLILLSSAAAGGWFFFKQYHIRGLDQLSLAPRDPAAQADADPQLPPPRNDRPGGSVRIASFNIQVFGVKKLADPRVRSLLAEVVRRFDIVAIQEVRATQDVMPQFLDVINSTGRHYDFVIGPRLGRTTSKEQYAFVFDTASVEVDRNSLYTVSDPDDLLHREPFVGWFRVRGPPPEQAFTFSLVDIHTDPDETGQELDALADVFRAVRSDWRQEDDVILLGDLNVDDRHLGRLGQLPGIRPIISGVASNTRGNKLYDNMVISEVATTEFSGRWGVFDLVREFNLTTEEALKISDHMPIWAEFTVYEGGKTGPLATRPFGVRQQ